MANFKFNTKTLVKLQRNFRIGFRKSAQTVYDKLFPVEVVKDPENSKKTHLEKMDFPDDVQKLFNYWLQNCHDSVESWKNRKQLYQDCDMMYYNCALISRAIELVADEVIQADSNQQPISVEASPEVKKFILEFFDKINIYDLLRPTLVDIIQYGDSGWLLGFDDTGVSEVIPVSVYDIEDRLEFTPYEVNNLLKNNDTLFVQFRQLDRVNQLIDSILNKENISSYFKKYLFGFQVADRVVPPWRFLHFRNTTNKSPFKPFGIPMFIHSIAPYRQLDAAMTLQVVARGMKFPKMKYTLNFTNAMSPTEKLSAAVEFLNELKNSGLNTSKNEQPGVGDTVIDIKDLYEFSQETPEINLDKIDDLQMLRDDLIISTQLPRNLIDPNDSGFGDSGVSLTQKWKPFARLVYRIQNIFLANLSQLIKIHMIVSNAFEQEDIDYILSMPYPESQVDNEIISSQNSLLDLANNVITALQDKLVGGESLPPEIVKEIYQKFLPYDAEVVEKWVNDIMDYKDKKEQEEEKASTEEGVNAGMGDDEDFSFDEKIKNKEESRKRWKFLEKEIGKAKLHEMVEGVIKDCKQQQLREGVIQSQHYFSSKNIHPDFKAEQLREFDKQRIQRLKENKEEGKEEGMETYYKEEVPYNFSEEKSKMILKENKKARKRKKMEEDSTEK